MHSVCARACHAFTVTLFLNQKDASLTPCFVTHTRSITANMTNFSVKLSLQIVLFAFCIFSVCASNGYTWRYELEDEYSGSTFFDGFWFQTNDYNHQQGAANFTTYAQAKGRFSRSLSPLCTNTHTHKHAHTLTHTGLGLIKAVDGQPVYIGVDHTHVVGAGGRPTVTINSNKVYTGGLIIGDFLVWFCVFLSVRSFVVFCVV